MLTWPQFVTFFHSTNWTHLRIDKTSLCLAHRRYTHRCWDIKSNDNTKVKKTSSITHKWQLSTNSISLRQQVQITLKGLITVTKKCTASSNHKQKDKSALAEAKLLPRIRRHTWTSCQQSELGVWWWIWSSPHQDHFWLVKMISANIN